MTFLISTVGRTTSFCRSSRLYIFSSSTETKRGVKKLIPILPPRYPSDLLHRVRSFFICSICSGSLRASLWLVQFPELATAISMFGVWVNCEIRIDRKTFKIYILFRCFICIYMHQTRKNLYVNQYFLNTNVP